ncbi:hypothetical protein GALL_353220 [mine drainage metagenome]|uniref:Uncharacterized protein n=1 Tax=mine drainage metagenome TaxID=410659 RepID=A0A1J5QH86_9ZZZZ
MSNLSIHERAEQTVEILFSGLRIIDWIYRHRIPGHPELLAEARKVAFVRLPRAFFNDATLRFEVFQQPVRSPSDLSPSKGGEGARPRHQPRRSRFGRFQRLRMRLEVSMGRKRSRPGRDRVALCPFCSSPGAQHMHALDVPGHGHEVPLALRVLGLLAGAAANAGRNTPYPRCSSACRGQHFGRLKGPWRGRRGGRRA